MKNLLRGLMIGGILAAYTANNARARINELEEQIYNNAEERKEKKMEKMERKEEVLAKRKLATKILHSRYYTSAEKGSIIHSVNGHYSSIYDDDLRTKIVNDYTLTEEEKLYILVDRAAY